MKTVSFETAKKLFDAGVVLNETEKVWQIHTGEMLKGHSHKDDTCIVIGSRSLAPAFTDMYSRQKGIDYSYIPAPTLCELLEVLPPHLHKRDTMYTLTFLKVIGDYCIFHGDDSGTKRFLKTKAILHENPAEAAGLLALQLLENCIELNLPQTIIENQEKNEDN